MWWWGARGTLNSPSLFCVPSTLICASHFPFALRQVTPTYLELEPALLSAASFFSSSVLGKWQMALPFLCSRCWRPQEVGRW